LKVSINLDNSTILYLQFSSRLVNFHFYQFCQYPLLDTTVILDPSSEKVTTGWQLKRANRRSRGAKNHIVTVKGH